MAENKNLFKEDEEQKQQKQEGGLFKDKKWNITMGVAFGVVIILIAGVAIWANM